MSLRRRLLLSSAPVVLVVIIVITKAVSVVVAGNAASSAYAARDSAALRDAVNTLNILNVAQSGKAHFAAGTLAVLDNRLDDAEREFLASVADTAHADSCPALVNLEFVRESLGDRSFAALDGNAAVGHYRSAQVAVTQAPNGCFAGNADADAERRTLRETTAARLDSKIAAAQVAPPPPPPPPAVAAGPPPPPVGAGTAPSDPDDRRRLDPGDPLDQLKQILRDAGAAQP
jgi:hypothetical protein